MERGRRKPVRDEKESTNFETKRYWIRKKLGSSCRPGDRMGVDRFDINRYVLVFRQSTAAFVEE